MSEMDSEVEPLPKSTNTAEQISNKFADYEQTVSLYGTCAREAQDAAVGCCFRAIDSGVEYLMDFFKKHCTDHDGLEQIATDIKEVLAKCIQPTVEAMKSDVVQIFQVSSEVPLPGDVSCKKYTKEDVEALDKQLQELIERKQMVDQRKETVNFEMRVQDELIPFYQTRIGVYEDNQKILTSMQNEASQFSSFTNLQGDNMMSSELEDNANVVCLKADLKQDTAGSSTLSSDAPLDPDVSQTTNL